jgi:LAS superfamily LD-carboxypeptidase LdcB
VHALSGARRPLVLTSALRDNRYQRVLMRVNANAARTYSLHPTGYAFDIARTYGSSRQASAFQFVLDRLVAANAIAYIREAGAIHVAVASDAERKLALLARAR